MENLQDIITQIELHSPEGIRKCFVEGVNPNQTFNGEPLIYELTSEYTRSARFTDCVKVFVEFGLDLADKALQTVLLDDAYALERLIRDNHEVVNAKYSLRCAYTPLYEVTLLHICAEFNLFSCAQLLIRYDADVNARAGVDEYGFGGQTPIFHTVNQNQNQSADMMNLLLSKSADLGLGVKGLIWGKGYEWETLIPTVNPISYAMMGLLPQMHRNEKVISETVVTLLNHEFGIDYVNKNVPNKYLNKA